MLDFLCFLDDMFFVKIFFYCTSYCITVTRTGNKLHCHGIYWGSWLLKDIAKLWTVCICRHLVRYAPMQIFFSGYSVSTSRNNKSRGQCFWKCALLQSLSGFNFTRENIKILYIPATLTKRKRPQLARGQTILRCYTFSIIWLNEDVLD